MKALCAVAALFVVVSPAFAQSTTSYEIYKEDVRKIVEANLSGRLRLAKGDNLEILPGIRAFTGSTHTWESQYLLALPIVSRRRHHSSHGVPPPQEW